nr:MAG TPA: hypothetical protein [Bacteriophage sp.]
MTATPATTRAEKRRVGTIRDSHTVRSVPEPRTLGGVFQPHAPKFRKGVI